MVVARTGFKLCPVNMLEKYLTQAGIHQEDPHYLFCPIVKTKQGEKLRESGALSYIRLRECFKQKLEALGFPSEQYGLHS